MLDVISGQVDVFLVCTCTNISAAPPSGPYGTAFKEESSVLEASFSLQFSFKTGPFMFTSFSPEFGYHFKKANIEAKLDIFNSMLSRMLTTVGRTDPPVLLLTKLDVKHSSTFYNLWKLCHR